MIHGVFIMSFFQIFGIVDSYGASLLVNEGESVYDFCWYPYMSVSGNNQTHHERMFFLFCFDDVFII